VNQACRVLLAYGSAENTGMRKGNVAHIDEVAQAVINAITEAERMSGAKLKCYYKC
jgi:cell division ATPase FtsA